MKYHEPFYHIHIISDSLHHIAMSIMYKISLSYFNFEHHMFPIENIQLGREITCIVLLTTVLLLFCLLSWSFHFSSSVTHDRRICWEPNMQQKLLFPIWRNGIRSAKSMFFHGLKSTDRDAEDFEIWI